MKISLISSLILAALFFSACQEKPSHDRSSNRVENDNTQRGSNQENVQSQQIDPSAVQQNATAQGEAATEVEPGNAEFSFEKDAHDFGRVVEGEKVTYQFKFTNTGSEPLIISDASAGCGCTVPDYSRAPVRPGETGFLEVSYNSHNRPHGQFNQTVTITANTTPNTTRLRVSGNVVER
jgi:hypothetical protein